MIFILGILGAAALFALMGYAATRAESRLGQAEGCGGESCTVDSCSIHGDCPEHGNDKKASGWWPDDKATYGDRK